MCKLERAIQNWQKSSLVYRIYRTKRDMLNGKLTKRKPVSSPMDGVGWVYSMVRTVELEEF